MNLNIIFLILIVHWIADFICQSDYDAKNKSSSWNALLNHTTIYSLLWALVIVIKIAIDTSAGYNYLQYLLFIPITFILHTVTDYITSREVKKLFDKRDHHNGFVVIGFDQILHYAQLILTWYFIIR